MSEIESKVVYYAHAICIYGSETESEEPRLIRLGSLMLLS